MQRYNLISSTVPLEQLPIDVLFIIFSHLGVNDLVDLLLVNKWIYNMLDPKLLKVKSADAFRINQIWEIKFRQQLPHHINTILEKGKEINWHEAFKEIHHNEYQDAKENVIGKVRYWLLGNRLNKLFTTVKDGDIIRLLKYNLVYNDLIKEDRHGNPLYKWAITNRHQLLLDYFYQAIILPDYNKYEKQSDNNKIKLFYYAVGFNQLEEVNKLLEQGVNINQTCTDNFDLPPPLFTAAQEGHLALVKALLEQGAEINRGNKNDATPLYIAAQNGHLAVAKLLLAQGAEVNLACISSGATPLFTAAEHGHLAVAKLLLEEGAEVNLVCTSDGATSLYIAAQNDHLAVVKLLLEQGAEVNRGNKNGATSLYIAAQNGHLAVVKLLLAQGAEVNLARTSDGATSLYIAAKIGHLAVVKLLLEQGANVNQVFTQGKTLLNDAHSNCKSLLKVAKVLQSIDLSNRLKETSITSLIKDLFQPFAKQTFSFSLLASQNKENEIVKELSKRPDWTYEECKDFINVKCPKELNPYSIISALLWAVEHLGEEMQKLQLMYIRSAKCT